MIITHIQYTVRAEYVAENQEYIRRILEDLRALGRTDIGSSIFVKEDGKTFLHFLFCENEEAEQTFSSFNRSKRGEQRLSKVLLKCR